MTTSSRTPFSLALACLFAWLALLPPTLALGAPPPGAPVVQIIELWEPDIDPRAQALTNALREVIFDAGEFELNTRSNLLLQLAVDAKCDTKGFGPELVEASDRGMTRPCLERLGKRMGAKTFFWGFLFKGEGGRPMVKAHLWQRGEDRAVVLPYADDRKRLAERLYRHLTQPGKVGDVRLLAAGVGAAWRGELWVNDRSQGPWQPQGVELTLPLGEVAAEVRAGDKVLARGRGAVGASGATTVQLEPVAEPPPAEPLRRYPPIELGAATGPATERGASALPWVFGGVGAVGLVGAGVFFALRQSERNDLGDKCASSKCLTEERSSVDRADRYGTLSLVSLGVGIAGVGAATYLFLSAPSSETAAARSPRVVGAAGPLVGGGFVGLSGSF